MESFVVASFVVAYLLWNSFVDSLLWNICCACVVESFVVEYVVVKSFVVEPFLWNSLVWNLCCGIFVVEFV